MRYSVLFFCLAGAVVVFVPSAHAQSSRDQVFSSYQYDPVSCDNRLGPTTEGKVSATFNGICTGGTVKGIEAEIDAIIGIDPTTGQPAPCSMPYIARAAFEVNTTTQLDDFCEEYSIDTVTSISEILDAGSNLVFHKQLSVGCDGGATGLTSFGTRPC